MWFLVPELNLGMRTETSGILHAFPVKSKENTVFQLDPASFKIGARQLWQRAKN